VDRLISLQVLKGQDKWGITFSTHLHLGSTWGLYVVLGE